jgi:hypothetical protein
METVNYLDWVLEAADRLEQLEEAKRETLDGLHGHSDTNRILKQWAHLVSDLGVLRNRDQLQISATPFTEWKFTPTSSGGAYLDGTVHVVVHRGGEQSRAMLMVRHFVRNMGGVVSRYVDEYGEDRTAGAYITGTNLPDKARDIVNNAIIKAWEDMAEPLADIWRECVAYQAVKEIRDGREWAARRLIAEHAEVK